MMVPDGTTIQEAATIALCEKILQVMSESQKKDNLSIMEGLIALTTIRSQLVNYIVNLDPESGFALFDFLLKQERLVILRSSGNVVA